MIYLYPDLRTAIVGKFHPERHTVIKGKEANIKVSVLSLKDDNCILTLRLEEIDKTLRANNKLIENFV